MHDIQLAVTHQPASQCPAKQNEIIPVISDSHGCRSQTGTASANRCFEERFLEKEQLGSSLRKGDRGAGPYPKRALAATLGTGLPWSPQLPNRSNPSSWTRATPAVHSRPVQSWLCEHLRAFGRTERDRDGDGGREGGREGAAFGQLWHPIKKPASRPADSSGPEEPSGPARGRAVAAAGRAGV